MSLQSCNGLLIYYVNTSEIPNHFTFDAKGMIYYVTIATVIFSLVKITGRRNQQRLEVSIVLLKRGMICFFFNIVIALAFLAGIVDDVIFVADANHDEIYLSPLSGNILSPLPFSNIESPMNVAFDPFEERVYWTDYTLGTVYRSTTDGMNQTIIRSNVTAPRGIDLDLVAGNVYWINSGDRTIEVSDLSGEYWKVLVYNLSSAPVDIALDTTKG